MTIQKENLYQLVDQLYAQVKNIAFAFLNSLIEHSEKTSDDKETDKKIPEFIMQDWAY
ncbi:TPA: hypothetical protein QCY71_005549 [Bacillus cereus]|nr:hypothetical protein [Bacillus cereus]